MKKSSETEKTIPYSWRLEKKLCKNECVLKWDTECLRERNGEDSEQSQKFEGKTEKKKLKTVFETQNTRFSQLIQVANQSLGHPPKHFKPKDLKILLSVFRDWKSHSQGSCELSHENLCIPLMTRPFTCEQVAKTNPRAHGCSMRLRWFATESPKQGNTVFEIFSFL